LDEPGRTSQSMRQWCDVALADCIVL
jgi:hypothetical protein